MDLGLEDRTALVLGGGGGLGKAIAITLAREGARVAVADIDPQAVAATMEAIVGAGGSSIPLLGFLSILFRTPAAFIHQAQAVHCTRVIASCEITQVAADSPQLSLGFVRQR